jgi:UDP-N-acetylglucosamine--N-acetylmuramyl-(pentapeptide) pyrophosphoryl-undecaprenol N-acetylglucosamine transferase
MGVPGKKIWLYPVFFVQLLWAFLKAVRVFMGNRPERVVSMGGYVSIPVALAARVLRIPVDIFVLDAVPGKAQLWLKPFAHHILICFKQAGQFFKGKKVTLTPYPLRFTAEENMAPEAAKTQLGLDQATKTLLILGGSQGSQSLNGIIRTFFMHHPELAQNVQVIHQAGPYGVQELTEFYKKRGIEAVVFDYVHELQYSYSAADLIIARAGAGTIFEVAFFGKPAILIPLEVATTSHQLDNAQAVAQENAQFAVFRQSDIEADSAAFYAEIISRLSS